MNGYVLKHLQLMHCTPKHQERIANGKVPEKLLNYRLDDSEMSSSYNQQQQMSRYSWTDQKMARPFGKVNFNLIVSMSASITDKRLNIAQIWIAEIPEIL